MTRFFGITATSLIFGAYLSFMATPALAACVTNANGDVFCYETLPPMPAPDLELLQVDLPPPPGYVWQCTIEKNKKKRCTPLAIKSPVEPIQPTPLQGTTFPLPSCGSGDPLKGLGIPSNGPKSPCPTEN